MRNFLAHMLAALVLGCSSAKGDLEIPLEPISEVNLGSLGAATIDADAGVQLEVGFSLAVGDGYPKSFVLTTDSLISPCGFLQQALTFRDVRGSTEAMSARIASPSRLEITVVHGGAASFVASGQFEVPANCVTWPAGARVPIEIHLQARAVRPASVLLRLPEGCWPDATPSTTPPVPAGGTLGPRAWLQLVDAEGAEFVPLNVSARSPAAFTLRPPAGTTLTPPDGGLLSLGLPGSPGLLVATPPFGPPITVEVVPAGRVGQPELVFGLPAIGSAFLPLQAGETYDGNRLGRRIRRVVPTLLGASIGGAPLCVTPPTAWFELQSLTPEVCDVRGQLGAEPFDFLAPGMPIGLSAYVLRDGACSLTLRAPEFSAGAGFSASVTTTFLNVDGFFDAP